jgi:hypothetical protein
MGNYLTSISLQQRAGVSGSLLSRSVVRTSACVQMRFTHNVHTRHWKKGTKEKRDWIKEDRKGLNKQGSLHNKYWQFSSYGLLCVHYKCVQNRVTEWDSMSTHRKQDTGLIHSQLTPIWSISSLSGGHQARGLPINISQYQSHVLDLKRGQVQTHGPTTVHEKGGRKGQKQTYVLCIASVPNMFATSIQGACTGTVE